MPHTTISPVTRTYARSNRKGPTKGEKAMWEYLRGLRAFGARFRREAPIGSYIIDFAWLSARIVIEVDGPSHDLSGRAERDQQRDTFLEGRGFTVLRFRDAAVLANDPAVFQSIEDAVRPLLQNPSPTPPRKGEGKRARGSAIPSSQSQS